MDKLTKVHCNPHRYPWLIIEFAVYLHAVQGLASRAVSERMLLSGVHVSHKTVFEWTRKFYHHIEKSERILHEGYDIEELCVKCNGSWVFLYRAHNVHLHTLDIYLTEKRNLGSAKRFFKKNMLSNPS